MADCLVDRLVRCKLRAGKSLVVENVWYVAVAVLLPSSWPQPSATDDANVQQYCLTCLGQRSQPRTIYNCPAPPLHRTSQYFPTKFLFHTLHSHLLTSTNKHTFTHTTNMGLMWHKGFGGRRAARCSTRTLSHLVRWFLLLPLSIHLPHINDSRLLSTRPHFDTFVLRWRYGSNLNGGEQVEAVHSFLASHACGVTRTHIYAIRFIHGP
ncbi:hypothetical protein GGP41_003579 [Bipolaris sorokiniana]|uniref:Uncharacterized protein n=1 Tax=Cochliobolus sativus TaxID=45130 RepID=A0A8H5ZBF3_COCSA|nr:hypothetical protein GGP41_003579 [Bipolaris sorokiniana]